MADEFKFISQKTKLKYSLMHHTPTPEQVEKIEKLRKGYIDLSDVLFDNSVEGRNLNVAITNLEDSLMWAIKAIILDS